MPSQIGLLSTEDTTSPSNITSNSSSAGGRETNDAQIDNMQEGEDYNDNVNMDEEMVDEDDEKLVELPEGPCRFGEIHLVHEKVRLQEFDSIILLSQCSLCSWFTVLEKCHRYVQSNGSLFMSSMQGSL